MKQLTRSHHTKQGLIAFSAVCRRWIAAAAANSAISPAQFRFVVLIFLVGLGIAPAGLAAMGPPGGQPALHANFGFSIFDFGLMPLADSISTQIWIGIAIAFASALSGWFISRFFPPNTDRMRIVGQPVRVRKDEDPEEKFATKAELLRFDVESQKRREQSREETAALRRDLNALMAQFRIERVEAEKLAEQRAVKLHDRINDMVDSVGELQGEMKHATSSITELTRTMLTRGRTR